MSLRDIQLHLSRFFCWHAGLGYGTRSSPQMKTSNMNLTLLTTNSKATKRWGAEEGLIITPCASRIPANPPTLTSTCNLSDLKLVGYKIMRGSRNFFGGWGVCGGGGGHDGQLIFF